MTFCEKYVKFCQFFVNLKTFFINNIKIILPIVFIIGIIILIVVLVTTSIKTFNKNTNNAIYKDRAERCLDIYNQPYIPIKNLERNFYIYTNPFYQAEMSYALRDYYWAASYKSYMPCGTHDDIVSYNSIRDNLLSGARVIHLDLFYDGLYAYSSQSKIIVGNYRNETVRIGNEEQNVKKLNYLEGYEPKFLDFKQCLNVIKENGFKTNQPLILYLEIGFDENKFLEYQVYQGLFEILGDKFVDKNYSFASINFGAIRMDKVLGKVLLVFNRKPVNGNLNEICNGIMNSTKNYNSINLYKIDKNTIEWGLKPVLFDKENALKTTKYVMTSVYRYNEPNKDINDFELKYTADNFDTQSAFDFGVQIIFMNFQKRDNYFIKFLDEFKDGGIKRKPDDMIFIPQPPPPVYERDKTFDFVKMNDSMFNGFENIQI